MTIVEVSTVGLEGQSRRALEAHLAVMRLLAAEEATPTALDGGERSRSAERVGPGRGSPSTGGAS